MDLDEWEFIPDDGFLEIHDDGGNKTYSRKYVKDSSNSLFNMNYFSPSSKSQKFVESPNQIVPIPIQLQPNKASDHEVVKEIMVEVPRITEKIKSPNMGVVEETDQESVSQDFFKKMKENEFVDMKIESPKSDSRGILPQIEAGKFQFEGKEDDTMETMTEKKQDQGIAWGESNEDDGGLNMRKWSLTGIGAICSFGVAAAATICIIILGSGPKNRQHQHNHQKLRFQAYDDDKRTMDAVQQASRINEAISAARGIPLSRAHITFGGYYDGL